MTRALREQNQSLQDSQTCIACADRMIDCVLLPCGHQVMCEACSIRVNICPIDRIPIQQRIRTYGR